MQDKYAGDVGDFGKFILLNELVRAGNGRIRLGVNWYHVTRIEHSSTDGRYIDYLNPENPRSRQFEECDPRIYSVLRSIVSGPRSIEALERCGVLPGGTACFSVPVPFGLPRLDERVAAREAWFERARRDLESANALFLDPDNGIETPGVRKTQTRAIEYAFIDEIQDCFHHCDLVVLYSHFDRTSIGACLRKYESIRGRINGFTQLRVLRFKRFSVRDYLFFCRKDVAAVVTNLFRRFENGPLGFLFEELSPE